MICWQITTKILCRAKYCPRWSHLQLLPVSISADSSGVDSGLGPGTLSSDSSLSMPVDITPLSEPPRLSSLSILALFHYLKTATLLNENSLELRSFYFENLSLFCNWDILSLFESTRESPKKFIMKGLISSPRERCYLQVKSLEVLDDKKILLFFVLKQR